GIDPNIQDATLVVSTLNWVLAEFVRLHHTDSADRAQRIVDELSTRKVPVIEEFQGFPKILRTDLKSGDFALILLYHAGRDGSSYRQLADWVRPRMRSNLRRTLRTLDEKALIHDSGSLFFITAAGKSHVETQRLLQPV
nr:hypothetical protein [Micromonospora sp. DSM 115978]